MSEHEGHLFVVHGRIESLVHDAAIVPVGSEFHFNPIWRSLVGPSPRRPPEWATRQWGRLIDAPGRIWAVSVGGHVADDYALILDRIEAVLRRVHERRDTHEPKRGHGALPLVAVPVVGIGRGGYGRSRGAILGQLVRRLSAVAREVAVDVALVTPDPAVYAAAQYARRDVDDPLPGRLEEVARSLGLGARIGQLSLFLGAGVSIPAGLPSWHRLIEMLADEFGVKDLEIPEADLTATDKAELIEKFADGRFQQRVASIVVQADRPSLPHGLLAGLDCREVITTNYDVLYERAVEATGRDITSVMPWASAHGAERWVLKLHGDIDHPDKIVLTRRHMVTYDAANRPSAAVLQSLLLTKRLLIVGASMTDDNVIRLAHEVQEYRQAHQEGGSGTFGTVLDASGDHLRARLWEGQLDWVELPELGPWPGHRGVELLLDRVAFHASRDSSWLLDARFEGLLEDEVDRGLAEEVRELYRKLPQRTGTKWTPLVQRLREMGVDSRPD